MRWSWAAAGAIDALRNGAVDKARARLCLMLCQAEQHSIDRGSWLLCQEIALESAPPYLTFHSLPNATEQQFSKLLDPRWIDAFVSAVKAWLKNWSQGRGGADHQQATGQGKNPRASQANIREAEPQKARAPTMLQRQLKIEGRGSAKRGAGPLAELYSLSAGGPFGLLRNRHLQWLLVDTLQESMPSTLSGSGASNSSHCIGPHKGLVTLVPKRLIVGRGLLMHVLLRNKQTVLAVDLTRQ